MIYQSLADPFYSKGENTAISGDPATSKVLRVNPHTTDRWLWEVCPSGSFSISNIKKALLSFNRVQHAYVLQWNNQVPNKVDEIPQQENISNDQN
ncbi:hypothetical protein HanPSC8_Chr15g0681531 [Helianthus annuus]|nr:hypothetical protein HanPSC8_Chr15g0681531 [Helianthus annuus]